VSSTLLGLWAGVQAVLRDEMTTGHLISYVMFAVDIVVSLGVFPMLFAHLQSVCAHFF